MKEGVDSTMNTDRKIDAHISYDLVEEVKDAKKRPFQKYKALLGDDGEPASVQQWATILAAANDDDPAIVLLNKAIASSPYQAVFFETPPVVGDSALSQQFQFVLVDAPQLHNAASENPDANTFATHMQTVDSENGVVFSNLGRDAILIAPKPLAEGKKCYSHLAPFVRTAPAGQVAAVWKMAAQAYLEHFSQRKQKPVWFSTSGLGIYWLHFRLDSVPKYYTYEPYKLLSR